MEKITLTEQELYQMLEDYRNEILSNGDSNSSYYSGENWFGRYTFSSSEALADSAYQDYLDSKDSE